MPRPDLKSWSFWKSVVLWSLSLVLAAGFLLEAAWPKLTGAEWAVEQFRAFGYPQWFRLLIGVVEGIGGLLLLVPRTASWGAITLSPVMVGAIATHLATDVGSPWHAMRSLVLLALIAWGRWPRAVRPGLARSGDAR